VWQSNDPSSSLDPLGLCVAAGDQDMEKAIKDVVEEMQKENWKPTDMTDSGAYGKEVHNRVQTKLTGSNWQHEIYVDNTTKKVVSVGKPPAGGVKGTTQVDSIYLKNGDKLKVGDVFDPSKVNDLYDVKTTLNGGIGPDQKGRLKKLLDPKMQRPIKTVHSPRRWTASRGWHTPNTVTCRGIVRALQLLGPIGATLACVRNSEHDNELEDIYNLMDYAQNQTLQGSPERQLARGIVASKLMTYFDRLNPTGSNVQNIGLYMSMATALTGP